MKPGDTIEAAIWLDGRETVQQVERHRDEVMLAMLEQAQAVGVSLTPLRWVEKRPGDDRVPPVPEHIQGADVRLLVAEADVTAMTAAPSNFLAELEPSDLRRLRAVTRSAYHRRYPGQPQLTDRQCDTLINDLGPEAAIAALHAGRATLQ